MSEEHSVTNWIRQLQSGSDDAAARLWQRFHARLVGEAYHRLQSSPVRAADADDVVQEAFHSFFKRAEAGQFPDLNDRGDLWKLLVTITERKALNQIRESQAKKRGGGKIRGESIFGRGADPHSIVGLDGFSGTEPSPEDCILLTESVENLLGLLDGDLPLIAVYKLEGRTNQEIAGLLDCAVATIERRLSLIRRLWSEAGFDEG